MMHSTVLHLFPSAPCPCLPPAVAAAAPNLQLGCRLAHVLRRILPISLYLLQKDGRCLAGHDLFLKRVGQAYSTFIEEVSQAFTHAHAGEKLSHVAAHACNRRSAQCLCWCPLTVL